MKAASLPDRGIIKVGGEDARGFLDGLVTTNIALVQPGLARFGALLTPQGKIVIDFLVTEAPPAYGGGFGFACSLARAPTLVDKLRVDKLRAKGDGGEFCRRSSGAGGRDGRCRGEAGLAFGDPRDQSSVAHAGAGDLIASTAGHARRQLVDSEAYEAHPSPARAARGIDYIYGTSSRTSPTWTCLHGVDFDKGCMSAWSWCRAWSTAGTHGRARARAARSRAGRSGPGSRRRTGGGHMARRRHGSVSRWLRVDASLTRSLRACRYRRRAAASPGFARRCRPAAKKVPHDHARPPAAEG